MKYLRLLRLRDQAIIFGLILFAGIYFHQRNAWVLSWGISVLCISFCAFMVNELVDREDCDLYSWNPIHIKKRDCFNRNIVRLMFVFFTVVAFVIAYVDRVLPWAIAIYVLSIAYSLKPFRLKTHFGFDVLIQLSSGIALPFLAVATKYSHWPQIWPILITALFFVWAIVFPYQLADFVGDKEAGFHSTHIVLGMKRSLIFGLVLVTGVASLYWFFGFFQSIPWANFFIVIIVYTFFSYLYWLRLPSTEKQIHYLQKYVRFIKPLSVFIIPYLAIVWLLVK